MRNVVGGWELRNLFRCDLMLMAHVESDALSRMSACRKAIGLCLLKTCFQDCRMDRAGLSPAHFNYSRSLAEV
jgi:hypothetical protein